MISDSVVIMTKGELAEATSKAFLRGVKRGRFEESLDRANSKARGSEGHLEATESTGTSSPDEAVRLANLIATDVLNAVEAIYGEDGLKAVTEHARKANHAREDNAEIDALEKLFSGDRS